MASATVRLNAALTAWYRPRRRAYPWRRTPPDPYHVLVSEVMLQQTQAGRVVPAFDAFVRRFPDVGALAAAGRDDVMRAWAGLGYNRRAVALSEAAGTIVAVHGGTIPREPEVLRALPGIGPYTAAAIASFAFGRAVPAIDVNVARVVSRVRLGREPHDVTREDVSRAAQGWIDGDGPAEWNQALMDLGRELCRPRPRCASCPLADPCRFRRSGARPTAPVRTQGRFEGSSRQVRGAVVRELRTRRAASLATLTAATGHPHERIAAAVAALHRDGVLRAGSGALLGRRTGLVRLAS